MGKRKQNGGNPIIPIIAAAVPLIDAAAKAIKPATKLKQTRLGTVPGVSQVLDFLIQKGYGPEGYGNFNTVTGENDNSMQRYRRLPLYPNEGLRSVPSSTAYSSFGTGYKMRGGGLRLFNY